jgi:hypothetical protein
LLDLGQVLRKWGMRREMISQSFTTRSEFRQLEKNLAEQLRTSSLGTIDEVPNTQLTFDPAIRQSPDFVLNSIAY